MGAYETSLVNILQIFGAVLVRKDVLMELLWLRRKEAGDVKLLSDLSKM